MMTELPVPKERINIVQWNQYLDEECALDYDQEEQEKQDDLDNMLEQELYHQEEIKRQRRQQQQRQLQLRQYFLDESLYKELEEFFCQEAREQRDYRDHWDLFFAEQDWKHFSDITNV